MTMTLKEVLMHKGHTEDGADEIISEIKNRMLEGEDPEDLLYEEGLEPDYVLDLIDYFLERRGPIR